MVIITVMISLQVTGVSSLEIMINRSDSWRNDTAHVDEIQFKIIQGMEQQLLALKDGEIDGMGTFVRRSLLSKDFLNDSSIKINSTEHRGFGLVSFNGAKWPTNQRGLRRALAFAMDKLVISEQLWLSDARPLDLPVAPSYGMWSLERVNSLDGPLQGYNYYDPDPIRGNLSLLRDGFYDIDLDGWREWFNATKAGMTWSDLVDVQSFNPDVNHPSDIIANESGPNPDAFAVYDAITFNDVNNWEEVTFEIIGTDPFLMDFTLYYLRDFYHTVGIDAKIHFVGHEELYSQIVNGTYNAAVFRLKTGPTPEFLSFFTTGNPLNEIIWRWSNATYDEKVKTMLTTLDYDKAINAAYDAQVILWYEQPLVVLYNKIHFSVYRIDKLDGWIQPLGKPVASYWSAVKVHHLDDQGNSVVGGQLRMALDNTMTSLNPLTAASLEDLERFTPLNLIYERLWRWSPYELKYVPWMADRWNIELVYNDTLQPFTGDLDAVNLTQSPIVQKITFHLNPNMKWHDGQPVLPEDVAFSYQLYAVTNSSAFRSLIKIGGGRINPNRITYDNDARTVTFIVEDLGVFSLADTGGWIFPKHIWEPLLNTLGPTGILAYKNDNPIGSGPYKWKSQVLGEVIILERNPDWEFRPDKITRIPESIGEKDTNSFASIPLNSISISLDDVLSFRVELDPMMLVIIFVTWSSIVVMKRRKSHKN